MSSEALKRAQIVRNAATALGLQVDAVLSELEAVLAVARERAEQAEKERDIACSNLTDEVHAAAVAREREQRLREALTLIVARADCSIGNRAVSNHGRFCAYHTARAALVDEPAAAAMPRVTHGGRASVDTHKRARASFVGSASAAADEPGAHYRRHIDGCVFHPDHEGPCEDDGEWVAAADEPGETPA